MLPFVSSMKTYHNQNKVLHHIKIVKCNSTVNYHPSFKKASSYSFVLLLFMSWSFTYSSFTLNSIAITGRPSLDSIDRGLNMDSLPTSTPFVWRYQLSSTSFTFFCFNISPTTFVSSREMESESQSVGWDILLRT